MKGESDCKQQAGIVSRLHFVLGSHVRVGFTAYQSNFFVKMSQWEWDGRNVFILWCAQLICSLRSLCSFG